MLIILIFIILNQIYGFCMKNPISKNNLPDYDIPKWVYRDVFEFNKKEIYKNKNKKYKYFYTKKIND